MLIDYFYIPGFLIAVTVMCATMILTVILCQSRHTNNDVRACNAEEARPINTAVLTESAGLNPQEPFENAVPENLTLAGNLSRCFSNTFNSPLKLPNTFEDEIPIQDLASVYLIVKCYYDVIMSSTYFLVDLFQR